MFFLWLICHGILSMLAQQISPLTPWVTAAALCAALFPVKEEVAQ